MVACSWLPWRCTEVNIYVSYGGYAAASQSITVALCRDNNFSLEDLVATFYPAIQAAFTVRPCGAE